MASVNLECRYCLGQLKVIGENHYLCEHCGNEVIEQDNTPDELQNLLISAYQDLRLTKFDDAQDRFSDITDRYPDCYMAYWGLCLAEHGVIFVEDRIEDKMVPTCYNMEIKSFLDNPNYRKAIELAPAEQVKNYEYQASKIELIRKEWIEEANKIAPYDIFISFKHRDEFGNETSDYKYLNDLWYELTYDRKLNVFFSPQTLKDKVSEQFEPYIYRALHTSKVMLLYGECKDYFETTWVKNEWTRYLRKIKNKEKDPKSLIVAYKNFNASELPSKLSAFQALDASKPQFINILFEHINSILNISNQPEKLERIEIKTEQISSKVRTINNDVIKKRELGSNYVKTNNIKLENILDTIYDLIEQSQFDYAKIQLDKAIELDPHNGGVKYSKFLIEHKISGDKDLYNKLFLNTSDQQLLIDLEEIINSVDKQRATMLLNIVKKVLLDVVNNMPQQEKIGYSGFERKTIVLYKLISQYNYEDRKKINKVILDTSSKNGIYLELFDLAIKSLDKTQVDEYIDYHIYLVKSIGQINKIDEQYIAKYTQEEIKDNINLRIYFLNKILKADKGNSEALMQLFEITGDIKYFETTLKYSKNKAEQLIIIEKYLNFLCQKNSNMYEEILKYIPENQNILYLKALKQRYEYLYITASNDNKAKKPQTCPVCFSEEKTHLYDDRYQCKICFSEYQIKKEVIEEAEDIRAACLSKLKWYVKQIIQLEGEKPKYLFDLFKYELGAMCDDDLIKYSVPLSELTEFNDLLPNLDKEYRKKILDIIKEQKQRIQKEEEEQKEERERLEQERLRREKEERERKEEERFEEEERKRREERWKVEQEIAERHRKAAEKDERRKIANRVWSCILSALFVLILVFVGIGIPSDIHNAPYNPSRDYGIYILIALGVIIVSKIIIYIVSRVNDYETYSVTIKFDKIFLFILSVLFTLFIILRDCVELKVLDLSICYDSGLLIVGIVLNVINFIILWIEKGDNLQDLLISCLYGDSEYLIGLWSIVFLVINVIIAIIKAVTGNFNTHINIILASVSVIMMIMLLCKKSKSNV